MAKNKQRTPEDLQRGIDARRRFHLSDSHVQMARELGMNPRKLGALANHEQEPWKAPLAVFIEHLYQKRFGKAQADRVISIEDRAQEIAAKKVAKRERRLHARIPPG
jgi:predicted Rossmann-fold nucleotide-binding protein